MKNLKTADSTSTPREQDNDLTALVHRAVAGDLDAFEELMTRFQRAIFSVALYKSKNYFDAEDLTQDIFLAAFKALPTLKAPENFSSWLFGIAYNRCHKWFRREKTKVLKFAEIKKKVADEERARQKASADEGSAPVRMQINGDYYQGNADHGGGEDHLADALRGLPGEIRQVLTLKFLEGCSYREIEKQLGINAHRIDYLIRKGKQQLRIRLQVRSERAGEAQQ